MTLILLKLLKGNVVTTDQKELRNALGQFATGVTVVTTSDEEKMPVGVTASSFNSVSLDPPLVLWSLSKTAKSMPAFENSGGFNVHILAAHQTDISNRFASSQDDKFDGIDFSTCDMGFPLLNEYAALFRCKTHYQYEGGDHIIFVGEVVEYQTNPLPVLIFHGGKYADARPKLNKEDADEVVDLHSGKFTENYLLYLISRAHFQTSLPVRQAYIEQGLSDQEFFCLSLLSMNGGLSPEDISDRLAHTGHAPDNEIFERLARKELINHESYDTGNISLTETGQGVFIELLAQSKALEEQLTKHFSEDEIDTVVRFMKKIVDITGSEIPELW